MMTYEQALETWATRKLTHSNPGLVSASWKVVLATVEAGDSGGCDTCDYGRTAATVDVTLMAGNGKTRHTDIDVTDVDQLLRELFAIAAEEDQ